MVYVYLKFVIYLLVAITSAKYVVNLFANLGSAQNKTKSFLLIGILAGLCAACSYLAISNAARFMFPYLNL